MLRINVYDTQCDAKVFRRGPALRAALEEPFVTRWNVDIELIGRLHRGSPQAPGLSLEAFVEMPLSNWRDVPGSKLRPLDFPKFLGDLLRVHRSLRKWERQGGNHTRFVNRWSDRNTRFVREAVTAGDASSKSPWQGTARDHACQNDESSMAGPPTSRRSTSKPPRPARTVSSVYVFRQRTLAGQLDAEFQSDWSRAGFACVTHAGEIGS